jgi:hypothetical protein
MKKQILGFTFGLALFGAVIMASAQNLIVNGNFENGNTGFLSNYSYVTGYRGCWNEGTYSVVNDAYQVHPNWTAAYDHTLGNSSGHYFVGNGSSDTSKVVWETTTPIDVTEAGTAYRFEAYVSTLVGVSGDGPSLTFQVGNGTQWTDLGSTITFNNGAGVGVWDLSFADGVFNSPGDYYIRLMNAQSAAGGNDFGLDDLYFGFTTNSPSYQNNIGVDNTPVTITTEPVPEPATLALTGLGALGCVLMFRRRNS